MEPDIDYERRSKADKPIGSGRMEKAVDQAVRMRQKRKGSEMEQVGKPVAGNAERWRSSTVNGSGSETMSRSGLTLSYDFGQEQKYLIPLSLTRLNNPQR